MNWVLEFFVTAALAQAPMTITMTAEDGRSMSFPGVSRTICDAAAKNVAKSLSRDELTGLVRMSRDLMAQRTSGKPPSMDLLALSEVLRSPLKSAKCQ